MELNCIVKFSVNNFFVIDIDFSTNKCNISSSMMKNSCEAITNCHVDKMSVYLNAVVIQTRYKYTHRWCQAVMANK